MYKNILFNVYVQKYFCSMFGGWEVDFFVNGEKI